MFRQRDTVCHWQFSEFNQEFPLGFIATSTFGVIAITLWLLDENNPIIGNIRQYFFEFFGSHKNWGWWVYMPWPSPVMVWAA